METNNRLTIRGDFDVIYGYASRIERWPEFLSHYRSVQILEPGERNRLVRMHCIRAFGPFKWPCRWQARQELLPEEGRINFRHVAGPAKGMEVEWQLEQVPGGVQTTISHRANSQRSAWSTFYWDRVIGPIFIQSIAEKTLETIKVLVESETQA